MNVYDVIANIKPLDEKAMALATTRMDDLIKPIGSLGRLEELAIQLAGITGSVINEMENKTLVIFCADNGVYEEGVSTAPQIVTVTQTLNFFKGITGAAVLAKQAKAELMAVDIGIREDVEHPKLIRKKIAYGTKNIAKGPAMNLEECEKAIMTGIELVGSLKEKGCHIIGTGEMGISNTTPATALICALSGCDAEKAAGPGAGLTKELFEKKKNVIRKALAVNQYSNPIEALACLGGFDIAGMTGCFLGAAYYRLPVVVDGVISIAAALAASQIAPLCRGYMLPSHASKEPSYHIAAKKLKMRPYVDLEMRLGEGSGCPFTFFIAQAAAAIQRDMVTFSEGNVDKKDYIDIRGEDYH